MEGHDVEGEMVQYRYDHNIAQPPQEFELEHSYDIGDASANNDAMGNTAIELQIRDNHAVIDANLNKHIQLQPSAPHLDNNAMNIQVHGNQESIIYPQQNANNHIINVHNIAKMDAQEIVYVVPNINMNNPHNDKPLNHCYCCGVVAWHNFEETPPYKTNMFCIRCVFWSFLIIWIICLSWIIMWYVTIENGRNLNPGYAVWIWTLPQMVLTGILWLVQRQCIKCKCHGCLTGICATLNITIGAAGTACDALCLCFHCICFC